MRLARLKIRNLLGIEELEIEAPGAVTVISGGNGSGKTSVLEALKAVLGGGHDGTLLRKGAEEGEAVLVLEDGTEIAKRFTAGGSKLDVKHPDLGRISAPQTWVNKLFDSVALDPAAFLATDGAGRVRLLMEAWPVEVSREALQHAIGDAYTLPGVDFSRHALEAIAQAAKLVYDERTGVNRTVKEKAATAKQLEGGLPEGDEDEDTLGRRLHDVRRRHQAEVTALQQGVELIRATLDDAKEAARAEAAERIRQVEAERDTKIEDAEEQAEVEEAQLRSKLGPALEEAKAEADRLEERRRHAAAHGQARQTAARMKAEAETAKAQSEALTAALERLDALRAESASEIPVDGLEIRDGEVHLDAIPFPRLNHAKQIEVAVALAAKRAGELGIVCVDGLEALDPDAWTDLLAGIEEAGLQAFVTRVTSGPLAVGGAA